MFFGRIWAVMAALALSGAAAAQLLPPVGQTLGRTLGGAPETIGRIGDGLDETFTIIPWLTASNVAAARAQRNAPLTLTSRISSQI